MQNYETTILDQSCCDSFISKYSNIEDSYFIQNTKDNFLDKSFEREMFSFINEIDTKNTRQKPENFENFVEDEPTQINIPRNFNFKSKV